MRLQLCSEINGSHHYHGSGFICANVPGFGTICGTPERQCYPLINPGLSVELPAAVE